MSDFPFGCERIEREGEEELPDRAVAVKNGVRRFIPEGGERESRTGRGCSDVLQRRRFAQKQEIRAFFFSLQLTQSPESFLSPLASLSCPSGIRTPLTFYLFVVVA